MSDLGKKINTCMNYSSHSPRKDAPPRHRRPLLFSYECCRMRFWTFRHLCNAIATLFDTIQTHGLQFVITGGGSCGEAYGDGLAANRDGNANRGAAKKECNQVGGIRGAYPRSGPRKARSMEGVLYQYTVSRGSGSKARPGARNDVRRRLKKWKYFTCVV